MPPRSPKMKRFIFGFQRRVWWPKWTPASRRSRIVTTDTFGSFLLVLVACCRRARVEPAFRLAGTATRPFRRIGLQSGKVYRLKLGGPGSDLCCTLASQSPSVLEELASTVQARAWELAVDVVEEGLQADQLPSLQRLGRLGQLGDMPTFIAELARELLQPRPERLGIGSALAAQARDHAREREALGFAPREIVTEFLLLRRVLWRFVSNRAAALGTG